MGLAWMWIRRLSVGARLALITLSASGWAAPAWGSKSDVWPGDPAVNVAVCETTGEQRQVRLTSDGLGGLYCAWEDLRADFAQTRLRRLNPAGASPGWPADGLLIADTTIAFNNTTLVPSGSGAVIVSWLPEHSDSRLRAQRVDSSGVAMWPAPGVAVSLRPITNLYAAVGLQDGGAMYFWQRDYGFNVDTLVAMRITAGGQRAWETEVVFCDRPGPSGDMLAAAVSDSEVVVTWGSGLGGSVQVFGQKLGLSGVEHWPHNGVRLLPNGEFGSIAATRGGGVAGCYLSFDTDSQGDLKLFQVDASGQPRVGWPSTGLAYPGVPGVPDGVGFISADPIDGSIALSWWDGTVSQFGDSRVQKFDSSGVAQWAGGGRTVFHAAVRPAGVSSTSDGLGGFFVALATPLNNADIVVQHIKSNGDLAWPAVGSLVASAAGTQFRSVGVLDSSGGLFLCWVDYRNPSTAPDLYAQHMNADGSLGGIVTATEASAISASYFDGCADIRWFASSDPGVVFRVQRQGQDSDWRDIGAPIEEAGGHVAFADCNVERGTSYTYRLEWVADGQARHSGVIGLSIPLEPGLSLTRLWPNPVRELLTTDFSLSRPGPVRLSVLDLSGRLVSVVAEGPRAAGEHRESWQIRREGGGGLAPGCYWLQLEAEGVQRSRQFVVVR